MNIKRKIYNKMIIFIINSFILSNKYQYPYINIKTINNNKIKHNS